MMNGSRTRGFENFDDWWKQVTYWINPPNGWPVLIPYTREDGSIHACTAIAVDGDKLEIYDPSPAASDIPTVRSDLEKVWSSTRPRLNHDVMAVEVKVGPNHHVEALHNYNSAALTVFIPGCSPPPRKPRISCVCAHQPTRRRRKTPAGSPASS